MADPTTLGYTIVMCGVFIEVWVIYEGFGMDPKNKTFAFYGDPENVWGFSSMEYVANCTVASLLLPFTPPQQQTGRRELRIPNLNTTLSNAITILQEVQGVTYKLIHGSVEEARKGQKYYHDQVNVAKELLANQKAQDGRDDTAIPEPWDNEVFENLGIQRLGLGEMFENMKMRGLL
ncbi:hypothetical protein BDZ45DRAFT_802422 [Acephala macrosclerotiorum]|nr:hypothetical protein BDZ45DRAFT_802422 [Acephala macrosclerotiorum]